MLTLLLGLCFEISLALGSGGAGAGGGAAHERALKINSRADYLDMKFVMAAANDGVALEDPTGVHHASSTTQEGNAMAAALRTAKRPPATEFGGQVTSHVPSAVQSSASLAAAMKAAYAAAHPAHSIPAASSMGLTAHSAHGTPAASSMGIKALPGHVPGHEPNPAARDPHAPHQYPSQNCGVSMNLARFREWTGGCQIILDVSRWEPGGGRPALHPPTAVLAACSHTHQLTPSSHPAHTQLTHPAHTPSSHPAHTPSSHPACVYIVWPLVPISLHAQQHCSTHALSRACVA